MPVGKIIALIAEEGDDISNLQVPAEDSSSSASSPKPEVPKAQEPSSSPSPGQSSSHSHSVHDIKHSRPLFPSVLRLLVENGISDADKIKGTGVRGMLTKGDVLAFLGKASNPLGTYEETSPPQQQSVKAEPPKVSA